MELGIGFLGYLCGVSATGNLCLQYSWWELNPAGWLTANGGNLFGQHLIMKAALQRKIDLKTKPTGALGQLEALALQIGSVQQTLTPSLEQPTLVVFAGDHGVANSGVSAYPQEVTYQMVLNFLQGGAAINVFSRQHGLDLKIVDAGVNFDFAPDAALIDAKIAKGTRSFLDQAAMTPLQFQACLDKGKALVRQLAESGSNLVGFGEMGIGNTSAAAMLMSYLCDLPLAQCVGKGTGINDAQLQRKLDLLQQAQAFHGPMDQPEAIGAAFSGFEMAQLCGAMLEAYAQNMLILVDGFIASSVFLLAHAMNPAIMSHAIFCHLSDESGHLSMLNHLGVTPLLRLGMRLGEGTGCAVAYPLIQSAVRFLNEMASFDSAGVSDKSES